MFDPWGKNAPVRDASGKIVSRCRATAMTVPVLVGVVSGTGMVTVLVMVHVCGWCRTKKKEEEEEIL